jgi:hypothetical protein
MNKWNGILQSKQPQLLLWLLLGMSVVYYCIKASCMSIGHDEAGTWLNVYPIPFGEFFTDKTKWGDANNHLLNTLCVQWLHKFFSPSLLVLRLPNMLAGVMYGVVTIRIAQYFKLNVLHAIALFVFMHASTFAMDFFSLARGYGLCVSFAVLSLYQSFMYLRHQKIWFLIGVLLASFLMIFSNFIGIQLLLANCTLLALFMMLQWKTTKNTKQLLIHLLILGLGSIIILLPFYQILQWLNALGEFKWGTASLADTYQSFLNDVQYQNYLSNHGFQAILKTFFAAYLLLTAIVLFIYFKKKEMHAEKLFAILFPFVMLIIMIVLHLLIGAQYPETRKAILYYPCIGLSLFFVIDAMQVAINNKIVVNFLMIGLSVFFIAHRAKVSTANSNREWWYNTDDRTMMQYLMQKHLTDTISIGCQWSFMPSLAYYQQTLYPSRFKPLVYNKQIDTITHFDYYYAFASDTNLLMRHYTLDTIMGNSFLLKHR